MLERRTSRRAFLSDCLQNITLICATDRLEPAAALQRCTGTCQQRNDLWYVIYKIKTIAHLSDVNFFNS